MRNLILNTLTPLLVALLTLFAFFVLIRGHQAPGGGFVGGLLLASAVSLYALARGPEGGRALLVLRPATYVAAGLVCASLSGLLGLVWGDGFFAPWTLGRIPGVVTFGAVPMFELGVFLVVHGSVSGLLLTLMEQ